MQYGLGCKVNCEADKECVREFYAGAFPDGVVRAGATWKVAVRCFGIAGRTKARFINKKGRLRNAEDSLFCGGTMVRICGLKQPDRQEREPSGSVLPDASRA